MPADKDLFTEERHMVTMSFGDHLEELRVRLILALLGLVVGVIITFIPPFLGRLVMIKMEEPASQALKKFYKEDAERRMVAAKEAQARSPKVTYDIDAAQLLGQIRDLAPDAKLPDPATIEGKTIRMDVQAPLAETIDLISKAGNMDRSGVVTLGPLEGITILFLVCTITGLVITSPWVFYQVWAFVAAGLYRHERHYVLKFLPVSLGLFLAGVFLCFFCVLPVTLGFLLQINVWLNIEPSLRLSEWMGFATILPLVFGICFQTPLVMLFLERIGILTAEDFRKKRKFAILIMVVVAALVTPGPDVFSQCMLAVPMIALYELGILLMGRGKSKATPPATT
jgi:sec-independent protein translocase protein TatC